MFRITHNIQVGNYRLPQVSGFTIDRSMANLTGGCSITIPRNIAYNGTKVSDLVKKGDAIKIEAGYDDNNCLLFSGYVKNITLGTPIEVHGEDEMYRLKQIPCETRQYPDLHINALLGQYLPADIENLVTDVSLGTFRISNNPSLAAILDYIRQNYGLLFYFRNKQLFGVMPSTQFAATADSLEIDFAVHVKADNLQYVSDGDVNLIIKVKTVLPDNTKLEVQEPEKATGGEVHTFMALEKKTEKELRDYALNLLATYKPGNLHGSITLYGRPLVEPGNFIKLVDADNQERNEALCQVEKVSYQMNQSFLQQVVTIGRNG